MKNFFKILFALIAFLYIGNVEFVFADEDKKNPFFSLKPELFPQNEVFQIIKTIPVNTENIIYMENQHSIDVIDPNKDANTNNYYPGQRGPNQLVIYTPKYGERTGTNEYGTEAVIENDMVVRLNGADSIIPENGFVISGHGKAKTWIMQNIQVGSKIYIDYENKTLKCFLTPESLLFAAKEKIREVNSLLEYYRQIDILYNDKKANYYLDNSKTLLRTAEKKPEKTQALINEAMISLENAIKNAMPYLKSELKGVWIRPTEDTPEKIEKTIENMYNAGITDIFLETFFHGKTIYNSEFLEQKGVISQKEEFIGFDPLDIWIKKAHKRKMKVHIWFECFYLGNDNPKVIKNHILQVYPEWTNKRLANYNASEPVPSLSEHNGYFLDPANKDVQEFLYGILNEITSKYKVDGINLDYIRYPNSVSSNYSNYLSTNWGYTKAARTEFQYIYGIDPVDIQFGTLDWDLWCLYRQNKISEFVKNVKNIAQPHKIEVTAVIFPDLNKCIDTKMQNWKLWSVKDYVDGFTPLILTGDKNTADTLLKDVINNIVPSTKIYPGIFVTFMGGTFEDLLLQIHKSREFNFKGTVIFDYAHLNDKYIDALKTRIYNNSYDFKPPKENKKKKKRKAKRRKSKEKTE